MAPKPTANPLMDKMRKALALQKSGEFQKAQRTYKHILKKAPETPDTMRLLPDANHLLGVCYRQLGDPKRAQEYIQKAISLADDRAPFYANLARTLSDMQGIEPESILACTQKALSLDPTLVEARSLQAISLIKMKRLEEAEEILQRLIVDHPDYSDAYRNYGVMLRDNKDYAKAVVFFFKCTLLEPENPEHHVQLARSRNEAQQFKESKAELERALKRFPDNGDLHHELARTLFKLSRTFEGLNHAEFAAKQAPENYHVHVTLGVHHTILGNLDDALAAYKKALSLAPDDAGVIEWNMSLVYLGKGELGKGWDLHPARFRDPNSTVLRLKFDKPEWQGENLSGKRLLLWPDQGMGDAMRSGTMIPDLLQTGANIIIELPKKLAEPYAYSFPEVEVRQIAFDPHTKLIRNHDYDYHCTLTDLARFFRRSKEDFDTAKFPAYSFDPEKARTYLERLKGFANKPIVGISWRSKNLAESRARYYLSAPEISPLLEFENVIYVNLQYQSIEREIKYFTEGRGFDFNHFEDLDLFDDIHGAAALTACCDLVISANTSVADIAGSYGVPCWRFAPPEAIITLGQSYIPWSPLTTLYPIDESQPASAIVPMLKAKLSEWLERFSPHERNARLGL